MRSDDLSTPPFRRVLGDLHALMRSDHRYRSDWLGHPCRGRGTLIQGTKHWEYPWALLASGLLDIPPAERARVHVLDVGSSSSVWPCFLAHLGYRVTAVDVRKMPTEVGLFHAAVASGRLRTVVGDITEDTAALGQFDYVTCLSVLEHIQDHVAALRCMRPHLVAGGRLVLSIEYGPPGLSVGSRRAWPWEEMQFTEATVPRFLAAAGFQLVGDVDWRPPEPWPDYLGNIPTDFPDSEQVGVIGLLLESAGQEHLE